MQQKLVDSRSPQSAPFGMLLKQWRSQRGYSQLDLAIAGEVSQRHVSFLESGRAKPSREMVLQLATVLEIPLRQQNLMLTAAGFAPIHAETDLSAPEMASIRKALDFMLRQQEPYPAVVVDRYWTLLLANTAATQFLATFIDAATLQDHFAQDGIINLMQVMFDPQGLRPFVLNWEDVANHLLQRLYRESLAEGESEQSTALLQLLMQYPGVPEVWRTANRSAQNALLLTVHLKREHLALQFFSTIATLGTPYDITLQELRVECFFPADETTEKIWRQNRDNK